MFNRLSCSYGSGSVFPQLGSFSVAPSSLCMSDAQAAALVGAWTASSLAARAGFTWAQQGNHSVDGDGRRIRSLLSPQVREAAWGLSVLVGT